MVHSHNVQNVADHSNNKKMVEKSILLTYTKLNASISWMTMHSNLK